jgi:hypothetical protein
MSGKTETKKSFELWRQDDHGNKYLVRHVATQQAADTWVETMTARGHKQTYWSTPCPQPNAPSHNV